MRSQLRELEIWRGMWARGLGPSLRTVRRARTAMMLLGGTEVDVHVEVSEGDGLALGVFERWGHRPF
jgi:hypothetical protein